MKYIYTFRNKIDFERTRILRSLRFSFKMVSTVLVLTIMVGSNAFSQGYIYLHKNATSENVSPDFVFNLAGGSVSQNYTLKDRHVVSVTKDVGSSKSGRLWAISGSNANSDNSIYYRSAGSSTWSIMPGGAAGMHIDGGPQSTHIHSNSLGNVFYWDGNQFYNTNATNAGDVAMDKNSLRVFHVKATGSDAGNIYQKIVSDGTWNLIGGGLKASRIAVAPNGELVSNSYSSTDGNVYISTYLGGSIRNLGSPGNTNTQVMDVAVGDDGVIYATKNTGDVIVYRYTGGYAAGGSWVPEPSSRMGQRITGGVNGQIWSSSGQLGSSYTNIYSRTPSGFWIDDEPIKIDEASNSVLIPVAPGTYSLTENAVSGWALGKIDVYDPNGNTTTDVSTRAATVRVEAGEVVHLVFKNYLVQSFAAPNDCSSPVYSETFGTGSETTVGGPLTGQTSYHYNGQYGETIWDGYYTIASNSLQPGFGSKGGNFKDHTSGNGTGRMMLVNASYDKGTFFTRRLTGLLPGVSYSFSAWVMNISNTTIKPNVLFQVIDPATGNVLASQSTGDITSFGQWVQSQLLFTAGSISDVDFVLTNNNIGGEGNDLALDDISFGLAKPNQPTVVLGSCNGSTQTIQITSPLGSSIEYSIDGTNYQSSPLFQVGNGTYNITARYVGSVGGCATAPVTRSVNLSECLPAFNCSNLAYQVTVETPPNSSLYSYNVATGSRTLLGMLSTQANAIGYNTQDNFIWGFSSTTSQVIKIGSNAQLTSYTIPNLPAVNGGYNVGEIIGDGYLFLYRTSQSSYYVVDINPARSTYLQLVDPTASFVLDTAPYGNTFTNTNGIAVSDLTYNASNGLLYGIIDPGASSQFRIVTINPVTRAATAMATAVTGGGIQTETSGYGSAFIDPTANSFYVFANTLGYFFRINLATNTASLVSTSTPSGSNDGASCPNAFLTPSIAGSVFHDPNGGNVDNSTGGVNTIPSGLYANLVNSAGNVVSVATVNSSGDYAFNGISAGTYTVVLSTTAGTVGSPAPVATLPAGWANTGEYTGASNTGNDGNPNGVSVPFTITASNSIDNVNFGIEQPPVASNDVSNGNTSGAPVTVAVLSNDTDADGTLDPTRVSLVAPVGATNVTTDASGDITSLTIPGQGTWTVNPTTGAITFTPVNGFTGNPTPMNYHVKDNAGQNSNDASVTITYVAPSTVSGNVFHDPDGSNVNNSTGGANSVPAGLHVNLIDNSGNVVATAPVNSDGTYSLPNVPAGQYTLQLSTNAGTVGSPAPATTLPAGWVNTGEFNGAPNTGNDDPNGISTPFTVSAGSSVTDVNFGIEQAPTADDKNYTLASAPTANSIINLSAGGDASSGATPGNLTGSDPEDGVFNSTTAPYGIVINTLPTNGTLIYDGTPITAAGLTIAGYDPTKLQFQFSGSGYTSTSFTYSVVDKAAMASRPTPATYSMQWDAPLPVTLVSFTVAAELTNVNLNWTTATEINNSGFEIQRSANAREWKTLGFVNSNASAGNSKKVQSYRFTDEAPLNGTNYYRLKQVDSSGKFEYSPIRVIAVENALMKISAYPNPVQDQLVIDGLTGSETIKIQDLSGRVISQTRNDAKETKVTMNIKSVLSGVYIISIHTLDGRSTSQKLIKTD